MISYPDGATDVPMADHPDEVVVDGADWAQTRIALTYVAAETKRRSRQPHGWTGTPLNLTVANIHRVTDDPESTALLTRALKFGRGVLSGVAYGNPPDAHHLCGVDTALRDLLAAGTSVRYEQATHRIAPAGVLSGLRGAKTAPAGAATTVPDVVSR